MEVWGVELEHAVGQEAAQLLDKVVIGRIETVLSDLPNSRFDCIVCNDVLEHLVDPYGFLDDVPRCLTEAGVLVVSIPNVRYWPHLTDYVLRGNWEYQNEGILDRTHLRFFTEKSIIATFERHGFDIQSVAGIRPYWSRPFSLFRRLTFGKFDDCQYQQFGVVARPRQRWLMK